MVGGQREQSDFWLNGQQCCEKDTDNKAGGIVNLFSLGYEGGRPMGPAGSVGSRDGHQSSDVPICDSSGGSKEAFFHFLFSDSRGHLYSLACSLVLHLQTTSTPFSNTYPSLLSNLYLLCLPHIRILRL